MAYQEHRVVYRQQMEVADENGVVAREKMQACYFIVMIDHESGDMIPTNKKGIIDIPLAKYPELQVDIESSVPKFIAAFEQEYQEEQAKILEALNSSQTIPE